ncbi:MAG: tetratricopeptide repeat protein [Planctomycetaceae bacterium]|nr:tetratricopeptide repeat protein [Planctomycetaceae bacterium]
MKSITENPTYCSDLLRPMVTVLFTVLMPLGLGCTNMTAEGRNSQGVRYFQQARYDMAISEFQSAVNQSPDSPEGYYNIGMTYHALAQSSREATYYAQAEQYYKLCLSKNQNHEACRRKYAELMFETGRVVEAFNYLHDWEVINKDAAAPKLAMAKLYLDAGRPEDALTYLNAAALKEPQNVEVYNALGKFREDYGDLTLALENYRVSYQINPMQREIATKIAQLRGQQVNSTSTNTQTLPQQEFKPPQTFDTPTRVASRNRF